MEATFPGPFAPAYTSITVTGPDDWEPVSAPGVVLAIAAPLVEGHFRTNLTVSIQRVLKGAPLTALADDLMAELQATYPDLEVGTRVTGEVSGLPAVAHEYAFTQAKAGTLFQIQTIVLASPSDAVQDLIQIHATCAGADAEALVDTLRATIVATRIG